LLPAKDKHMRREFGKRVFERPPSGRSSIPTPAAPTAPKSSAAVPDHRRKALVAIMLTVAVVGGMFFVLPKIGQCDGRKGALGVDWCHAMKAGVEGAARGVAAGRGTIPTR
jgi:hypothetical protein